MASQRVVTIKLIAEATGLVQGFNRAKDAVAETKTKVEESARSSREAWSAVGAGLTAVGVAVTGVGVAALRTGIQYNTLQQTSRAALTSLLGSAQAANAQMDKLDDFARNSPFSKATFITAQQQMLAFGIEAKKVIPYLDGIQNAVAAAGGSNADIEGIVATMSKIQSSSKITATDLMEFGNRGVNAADLIGSQMGKTGAQIREDITAGTLSAEDALDALAKGMTEAYSGAADNVKNTFAGSLDRVKAAWRDFSAELAKPLVDPNGGGALVDLLNWAADAMRAFEDLPTPVKTSATTLVGLAGASALFLGSAMLIVPRIVEFTDALSKLRATGDRTATTLRWVGRAATAVAIVGTIAAFVKEAEGDLTGLTNALERGASASTVMGEAAETTKSKLGVLAAIAPDVKVGVEGVAEALEYAAEKADKGLFWTRRINDGELSSTLDALKSAANEIAKLGEAGDVSAMTSALAELSTGYKWTAREQWAFIQNSPALKSALEDSAGDFGLTTEKADLLKLAFGGVAASAEESGDASESAARKYLEQADAAKNVTDQLLGLIDALSELNSMGQTAEQTNSTLQESYAKLQEHVANAQAGVEGYSASLDEWTVAGSANRAMLADYAADVEKNAKAQFDLEAKTLGASAAAANFEARLAAGRQQIYDTALALTGSADEAQKLTDKILGMPDQKDIDVLLKGAAEVEAALNTLARRRETEIGVRYTGGSGTMTRANGGTIGYAVGGTIGLAAGGVVPGVGGAIVSGTVFGRGTETSDSVLVRLSRGEEVIRASEAAKHRSLLKSINAGTYSRGFNARDFAPSSMTQQPIIVVPQAPAAPVIGGNLQFVSSGNLHSDVGTVMHELRKRQRGGKYTTAR
ncbi:MULTISPECIES: tape measure protein [unclassified Leucobacter]|uniref:tape measure protein n=1 Tax=unclassified Leucobacter TaxID=2621730 RepID=UPI00301AB100